jgi:hypothetical protein
VNITTEEGMTPAKKYLVFSGEPTEFSDLESAEDYASERCEVTRKTMSLIAVDASQDTEGLIYRYTGVTAYSMNELR